MKRTCMQILLVNKYRMWTTKAVSTLGNYFLLNFKPNPLTIFDRFRVSF